MKSPKCSFCHTELGDDDFLFNPEGVKEYWLCPVCQSDRVGDYRVRQHGYRPGDVHEILNGRKGYRGVNIYTVALIILRLRLFKLFRLLLGK